MKHKLCEATVVARGRLAVVWLLTLNFIIAALYVAGRLIGYEEVAFNTVATLVAIQLVFLCAWFVPSFLYYAVLQKNKVSVAASKALWSFVEVLSA